MPTLTSRVCYQQNAPSASNRDQTQMSLFCLHYLLLPKNAPWLTQVNIGKFCHLFCDLGSVQIQHSSHVSMAARQQTKGIWVLFCFSPSKLMTRCDSNVGGRTRCDFTLLLVTNSCIPVCQRLSLSHFVTHDYAASIPLHRLIPNHSGRNQVPVWKVLLHS